jgi:hypothetical protein
MRTYLSICRPAIAHRDANCGFSVAVPRLNIIIDLICRQFFSERNSRGAQFILPATGGDVNEQCQIPEVQSLGMGC